MIRLGSTFALLFCILLIQSLFEGNRLKSRQNRGECFSQSYGYRGPNLYFRIFPNLPIGQQIRITDDLYQSNQGRGMRSVDSWVVPMGENLYCIGDPSISNLRFTCLDCNQSSPAEHSFVQELARKSREEQNKPIGLQGTVLKLERPAITADLFGKTLRCEGTYQGGSGANGRSTTPTPFVQSAPGGPSGRNYNSERSTGFGDSGRASDATETMVHADARMNVHYAKESSIASANGVTPLKTDDGAYAFFLRPGESITLQCAFDAYPPATSFKWISDGVVIASTKQITVDYTHLLGKSISCAGANEISGGFGSESAPVRIDPFDPARVISAQYVVLSGQYGGDGDGNREGGGGGSRDGGGTDGKGGYGGPDNGGQGYGGRGSTAGGGGSSAGGGYGDGSGQGYGSRGSTYGGGGSAGQGGGGGGLTYPVRGTTPEPQGRDGGGGAGGGQGYALAGGDGSNSAAGGGKVSLQCIASSQPVATIFWWEKDGDLSTPAACQGDSKTTLHHQEINFGPGRDLSVVQSRCVVPRGNKSYWCSACNQIVDAQWICDPKPDHPADQRVFVISDIATRDPW